MVLVQKASIVAIIDNLTKEVGGTQKCCSSHTCCLLVSSLLLSLYNQLLGWGLGRSMFKKSFKTKLPVDVSIFKWKFRVFQVFTIETMTLIHIDSTKVREN